MKLKKLLLLSLSLFPLIGIAQEATLESGDVQMNVNKASDNTYYISYSAYGSMLNGSADANPALFVDTDKEFYVRYTSFSKNGSQLHAVAEFTATPSTIKFVVNDVYTSQGNGMFQLDRKVEVASLGSNPYTNGFYTSFGLQIPDNVNTSDNDYLIPSVLYKGNFEEGGNIPSTMPQEGDAEICYREDRITLPMVMSRRKTDGLTTVLIHAESECNTTLNDCRGVKIDAGYQFGGVGVVKRKDKQVSTIVTYPGNDSRSDGMGERRHPLEEGFAEHEYTVVYQISKTDSYADAVDAAWTMAFDRYNPPIYQEDLNSAYSELIETVNHYYMAPGGDVKGPGFPWGVNLRDFSLNRDTYELGFVGAQPVAGYALFRAGLEEENDEYRDRGEQVLTFWATRSLSQLGLPKSRFAALAGTWDDWAYTSIRQGCNGMAGLLNAYCYAKKNGINRPAWINACCKFGDFLVENQNSDGSFYLEYQPFKIENGRHPAGNLNKRTTTCSLRYLVELYIATGDERYKSTLMKAAEYAYQNVHLPYLYVACVIDNPQTIDSESGQQAINGFLAVYDFTGDKKWLEAAEQAAVYTASWTFMYDIPVETDQTAETDWPRERSIVGQHIIAVGHSAADLGFAWSSFVYYRLYLLTGKEKYLHIARIAAHDSKQSMNLGQSLYPGQPGGLQQEAFTARVSSNPRRTKSVMEALTWNFAAHLDPMLRFKDAFGTCDLEEVEKMPKEEVERLNSRYAKYQSSDYGQDASVDTVAIEEADISVEGRTIGISGMPLCGLQLYDTSGSSVFSERLDSPETTYTKDLIGMSSGCYLLVLNGLFGIRQVRKIILK